MKCWILLLSALCVCSCVNDPAKSREIVVLVDVSGTYIDFYDKAVNGIGSIIFSADPGDRISVLALGSAGFASGNSLGNVTVPYGDLRRERVIKAFRRHLLSLEFGAMGQGRTDIGGSILAARELFSISPSHEKFLVIFSDMDEELRDGDTPREISDLKSVHVMLVNVKRLKADNADPERYFQRLNDWRARLSSAGASAVTQTESAQLERYFR